MEVFSLKPSDTKVTSSSTTEGDRSSLHILYRNKHKGKDEQASGKQSSSWDGQERRSGEERRRKNTLTLARLDGRNKTDRRASRLSIQI